MPKGNKNVLLFRKLESQMNQPKPVLTERLEPVVVPEIGGHRFKSFWLFQLVMIMYDNMDQQRN